MQVWRNEIDRRSFLRLAAVGLGAASWGPEANSLLPNVLMDEPQAAIGVKPILNVETDPKHAWVTVLSWDTEGGDKARTNLLRLNSPLVLRFRVGGRWRPSDNFQTQRKNNGEGATDYALALSPEAEVLWTIHPSHGRLTMTVTGRGSAIRDVEAVEMLFPFDPQVTPTTIIPQTWCEDGCAKLPAVLSSPDFGQMLLEDPSHPGLKARLEGSREKHTVDLILEPVSYTHLTLPTIYSV